MFRFHTPRSDTSRGLGAHTVLSWNCDEGFDPEELAVMLLAPRIDPAPQFALLAIGQVWVSLGQKLGWRG